MERACLDAETVSGCCIATESKFIPSIRYRSKFGQY